MDASIFDKIKLMEWRRLVKICENIDNHNYSTNHKPSKIYLIEYKLFHIYKIYHINYINYNFLSSPFFIKTSKFFIYPL